MTIASTNPWAHVLAEFSPPVIGKAAEYRTRPAAFARDMIRWPDGMGLTAYQEESLETLVDRGRLAVRGPHGLGKTTLAAMTILWFAITRDAASVDWKLPTTASAWRQLRHYLWPEVHKWARLLRWERLERAPLDERTELLALQLKLGTGEAFAAACDDPTSIEGAHADSILYLYDEAKSIPAATFDAAEGAFAGAGADTAGEAFALALSTPGEPAGRFYDIHRRAPGTEDWAVRHVTLSEALKAGRVSKDWADNRARQWGATSAVYANRVEGKFASSAADGVIPLSWVEAANERWAGLEVMATPEFYGVDVGLTGDLTVVAPVAGDVVGSPIRPEVGSTDTPTTQIAGHVLTLLVSGAAAVVDADGIGAGVVDQIRTGAEGRVFAFHAAGKTTWRDRSGELAFANLRAAAWWSLRDDLNPDFGATVALPPDDNLTGDLTAPHWRYGAGGRILIESKDDIRKRLGRSTDTGDAVVMGRWGAILRAETAVAVTSPARARIPIPNSSATSALRSPFGVGR